MPVKPKTFDCIYCGICNLIVDDRTMIDADGNKVCGDCWDKAFDLKEIYEDTLQISFN